MFETRIARSVSVLSLAILVLAVVPATQAQDERPLATEDFGNVSFRSIGPANVGGRVSSIALVPGSRRSFSENEGALGELEHLVAGVVEHRRIVLRDQEGRVPVEAQARPAPAWR